MTINQTFGEWELITDEPGDEIYWEHLPSGTRMEFRPDGTMASPSVQTDQLSTESRGPTTVVHVKDDGTIVADGPDGKLDSGNVDSPTDVTSVLQAAIDAGGYVAVKPHSLDYVMAVGGQDAEGVDYCLSMRSAVTLEIQKGATLRYPAQNTSAGSGTPDVASPILATGVDNWHIVVDGEIDGGASGPDQNSTQKVNAMGIKIGCRNQTGTGCKHFRVSGSGTLRGAYRHGVEAIQPRTFNGRISIAYMVDPGGDDAVSIAGEATNIIAHDITANRGARDGGWGPGTFEIEDGASHSGFLRCYAEGGQQEGFILGKAHSGWPACENIWAKDCHVINMDADGTGAGFVLGDVDDGASPPKDILLNGFSVRQGNDRAIDFRPTGGDIESVTVKNGHIADCPASAVFITDMNDNSGNDIRDVTFENVTFRNVGNSNNSPIWNVKSSFKNVTLRDCDLIGCHEGLNVTEADKVTIDGGRWRDMTGISLALRSGSKHRVRGLTVKNQSDVALVFVDGASDVQFDNCQFFDDQSTMTSKRPLQIVGASSDIVVSNSVLGPTVNETQNSGTDVRFENCDVAAFAGFADPVREVIDGRGLNDGDPSSTGQWNGEGEEGLVVYDTSVSRPFDEYQYVDGQWQSA
jgi:hypothetical protein